MVEILLCWGREAKLGWRGEERRAKGKERQDEEEVEVGNLVMKIGTLKYLHLLTER